jgi:hypothetical protein
MEAVMRRRASVLLVLVLSLVLWASPTPAGADPADRPGHGPPGIEVTGWFTGGSTYEFSQDPACNFVVEQYTGTYDPERRGVPGGRFTLDVCVSLGEGFAVDGTFEIVGDRGLTLRGTVEGEIILGNGTGALQFTLTVTESRGLPVRGTIEVLGTRVEPAFGTSDVDGTFTADLRLGWGGRP